MSIDQIPPPRWNPKGGHEFSGNYRHGKYAGLTKFLKALAVGQGKEAPREWERLATTKAKCLGIKIVTRRLGATDKVTIYRVE